MRSSSSPSSSINFILQRSLNPLAPRPFGLVALRSIKKNTIFHICTTTSDMKNKTSSIMRPITVIDNSDNHTLHQNNNTNNDDAGNESSLHLRDLSQPPKTLYDLLFRRLMWNMKEFAIVDHDVDENDIGTSSLPPSTKYHLPPRFLMLTTSSTVYALTEPQEVAKQIFDINNNQANNHTTSTNPQEEENNTVAAEETENISNTLPDNLIQISSKNDKKSYFIPSARVITLAQLLNINDCCSVPVPAPLSHQKELFEEEEHEQETNHKVNVPENVGSNTTASTKKNPSDLDPDFWRNFPQLMQQYEEISYTDSNCVLELVSEEELEERGVLASSPGSAKESEKDLIEQQQNDDDTKDPDSLTTREEDRILERYAQEYKVGQEDEDAVNEIAEADNENGDELDEDIDDRETDPLLMKRYSKARDRETKYKRGKDGGPNSPYHRREAKRRRLKGEEPMMLPSSDSNDDSLRSYGGKSHQDNNKLKHDEINNNSTLHLILRTTKPLHSGQEFHLSYGREYWTQFAGACAFTSSPNIPRVRWVEKYLAHDYRDLPVSFPDVTIGRQKTNNQQQQRFHLVDRSQEAKATDEAVLAEFVRRISLMPQLQQPSSPSSSTVEQQQTQTQTQFTSNLLRSTLDKTAHRLLEKTLREVMTKRAKEGHEEDEGNNGGENLVQLAADKVAEKGTDGLLKQELTIKDIKSLLAEDILKSKIKRK